MKKVLAVLLAMMLVLLTGCAATPAAQEATTAPTEEATTEPTAAPTAEPAEEATAEPAEEATEEETADAESTKAPNPVATITMENGGVITLELLPSVAPNTVANFISLANSEFYDGLIFHRVISGFMIQGGCPNGNGSGNAGYYIEGEFQQNGFKNLLSHRRGVISMARSTLPDSASCQFFIMHQDGTYLDGQYAAFGKVTSGMDVVDEIAGVATDSNDKPLEDQVIKSIRVETYGVEYEVNKLGKSGY